MTRVPVCALFVLLAALLACKASTGSDGKASVNCQGTNESIDCDVTHVAGESALNVCWGLTFACQNGTTVTGGPFCQSVEPSSTAQKRIPLTELSNAADCDKALGSQVVDLKITTE